MKTIIFENCTYDELKEVEGLILSTGLTIYSITWDLSTKRISVEIRESDTPCWEDMFEEFNLNPMFERLMNN